MNSFIKNSSLILASLLVAFGASEVVTRLFFKESIRLTPRYHTGATYGPVTLRRNRPNMRYEHVTIDGRWQFTTNKQGFRNYEDFEYEKPKGVTRVVSIGDSHTQGHECDQDYTYSAIVSRYLAARNVDAQVMNTGVSGFGTAEALLTLKHELVKYQPDYIILGFFENDFEDNLKSGLFDFDDAGELRLVNTSHIPGVRIQDIIYSIPGFAWLGENSYFYSLLFNTTWELYKTALSASARRSIPQEYAVASKAGPTDYEVKLTEALLRELYAVSEEVGAKLVVLDIPRGIAANTFRQSIKGTMQSFVAANSDHFVDASLFEPYQGVGPMHVPNGGRHITEFTHTLLGTAAAKFILQDINSR